MSVKYRKSNSFVLACSNMDSNLNNSVYMYILELTVSVNFGVSTLNVFKDSEQTHLIAGVFEFLSIVKHFSMTKFTTTLKKLLRDNLACIHYLLMR